MYTIGDAKVGFLMRDLIIANGHFGVHCESNKCVSVRATPLKTCMGVA